MTQHKTDIELADNPQIRFGHKTTIGFIFITIGTIASLAIFLGMWKYLFHVGMIMQAMSVFSLTAFFFMFCAVGAVVAGLPWKKEHRNFTAGSLLLAAGQLILGITAIYFFIKLPSITTFKALVINAGVFIGAPIAGFLFSACGSAIMQSEIKSMKFVKWCYVALMTSVVLMFMTYMTAVSFIPKTEINNILSNNCLTAVAHTLLWCIGISMFLLALAWFSSTSKRLISERPAPRYTYNKDWAEAVKATAPPPLPLVMPKPKPNPDDHSRYMPAGATGVNSANLNSIDTAALPPTNKYADYDDAALMEIVETNNLQWDTDDRETASAVLFDRRSPLLFERLGKFSDSQLQEVIASPHIYYKGYISAAQEILSNRNKPTE